MSGGFSTVFEYIFFFFMFGLVVYTSLYMYHSQLREKVEVLDSAYETATLNYESNYLPKEPFSGSGRTAFYIENIGDSDLDFIRNNNICFTSFSNGSYLKEDNLFMNILNVKPTIDYQLVEKDDTAIIYIQDDSTFSAQNKRYQIVSCDDLGKTYVLEDSKYNWYNETYNNRKQINVENTASENIVDYQIELNLDQTDITFNNQLKDIRFVSTLDENLVLDLTFDNYNQRIDEYSRYNNIAFLGNNIGVELVDPAQRTDGAIISALEFDGSNDRIVIQSDDSLKSPLAMTFSAWINWSTLGGTTQAIYSENSNENEVLIINDGGVNDNKILFTLQIDGVARELYSNSTIDNNWYHITTTYDGLNMNIYIDGELDAQKTIMGNRIYHDLTNHLIGRRTVTSQYYYRGLIDEVKLYNIPLKPEEIQQLYHANLRYRELDYYINQYNNQTNTTKIFVKIPYLQTGQNTTIQLYYNITENITMQSHSSIEDTFSYDVPREVGYVLNDRITGTNGVNILSLYDDNIIFVGDDNRNLSTQAGTTIASASLSSNDIVKMRYLANVEGDGQGDDMITPISWAGTQFHNRGFRNGADRFCMIAPWGNANVEIRDNGVIEWAGAITNIVNCVQNDITTANTGSIISDMPILVSYRGNTNDAFIPFPATTEPLYGVPSQNMYIGSSISGAEVDVLESDGASASYSLGAWQTVSDGGNGGDGNTDAYRVNASQPIGVIQEADNDGSEATVFVTETEMGTIFGSNEATDYVTIASPHQDANCTMYDNTGAIILNIPTGTGSNGVYRYHFGVGNDNLYTAARWMLKCTKPVWPYYENSVDNDDETNLFGHMQMRQYVYPEPTITIS